MAIIEPRFSTLRSNQETFRSVTGSFSQRSQQEPYEMIETHKKPIAQRYIVPKVVDFGPRPKLKPTGELPVFEAILPPFPSPRSTADIEESTNKTGSNANEVSSEENHEVGETSFIEEQFPEQTEQNPQLNDTSNQQIDDANNNSNSPNEELTGREEPSSPPAMKAMPASALPPLRLNSSELSKRELDTSKGCEGGMTTGRKSGGWTGRDECYDPEFICKVASYVPRDLFRDHPEVCESQGINPEAYSAWLKGERYAAVVLHKHEKERTKRAEEEAEKSGMADRNPIGSASMRGGLTQRSRTDTQLSSYRTSASATSRMSVNGATPSTPPFSASSLREANGAATYSSMVVPPLSMTYSAVSENADLRERMMETYLSARLSQRAEREAQQRNLFKAVQAHSQHCGRMETEHTKRRESDRIASIEGKGEGWQSERERTLLNDTDSPSGHKHPEHTVYHAYLDPKYRKSRNTLLQYYTPDAGSGTARHHIPHLPPLNSTEHSPNPLTPAGTGSNLAITSSSGLSSSMSDQEYTEIFSRSPLSGRMREVAGDGMLLSERDGGLTTRRSNGWSTARFGSNAFPYDADTNMFARNSATSSKVTPLKLRNPHDASLRDREIRVDTEETADADEKMSVDSNWSDASNEDIAERVREIEAEVTERGASNLSASKANASFSSASYSSIRRGAGYHLNTGRDGSEMLAGTAKSQYPSRTLQTSTSSPQISPVTSLQPQGSPMGTLPLQGDYHLSPFVSAEKKESTPVQTSSSEDSETPSEEKSFSITKTMQRISESVVIDEKSTGKYLIPNGLEKESE
ncbi:uncharacterized protein MONOS_7439 [Monocercomonoides exilis]|uniref:uncharacterized protein n=1 Tax=Monocercomonoides exilis TaxID=2049356 RepID=UPI0035594806|nr:hypothetical protein MONOS_7439 [Monocercomonoides exilis]|eukprot:MONOS_7439.1-p1 / transcript=MONOS_7439.1 / gene=MONOS_7439 / organism=Monocercomonoides_exilis_PA203 / gene_product=unspecified product / transcript_product=unspecified product / location=Mono_scaffold00254:35761-38585(+) / protein_length=807 / sequence_SO=supercontig / SO=protein_coding / is_pseudo=false